MTRRTGRNRVKPVRPPRSDAEAAARLRSRNLTNARNMLTDLLGYCIESLWEGRYDPRAVRRLNQKDNLYYGIWRMNVGDLQRLSEEFERELGLKDILFTDDEGEEVLDTPGVVNEWVSTALRKILLWTDLDDLLTTLNARY